MSKRTTEPIAFPVESSRDVLHEVLRAGAHEMLIRAVLAEVDDHPTFPIWHSKGIAPFFIFPDNTSTKRQSNLLIGA